MSTAKVIQERVFLPYVPYVDSARHFCAELDRKNYVSWHDLLAAVTLLALSIEAIANTIGEFVITDFKDFESSSPKAKIRLICEKTGVDFDRNKFPFVDVFQLLKIRNQLAHPKFQRLRYESKVMPLKEAQEHYHQLGEVLHDIEKALTPDMAKKSLLAVLRLAEMLRATIDPKVMEFSSKRLVIDDEDVCKPVG